LKLRRFLWPARPVSYAKPVLLRFEQLEDRTAPASYFTLQNPGPLFTQEGEVVSLHLNEYLQYTQPPPETAGSIAFTASGLPPGLTLDALSGVITGSPDYSIAHPDQSSVDFTITLTASDGTESHSVTFTWTILDAPDAANNPSGPPDSPTSDGTLLSGSNSNPDSATTQTSSSSTSNDQSGLSNSSTDNSSVVTQDSTSTTQNSPTDGGGPSSDNSNYGSHISDDSWFQLDTDSNLSDSWIDPHLLSDPEFDGSFPDITQPPSMPDDVAQQFQQLQNSADVFTAWLQALDNDPTFANAPVTNANQPATVAYQLAQFSGSYQRSYTVQLTADNATAYFETTISSSISVSNSDGATSVSETGTVTYTAWLRVQDEYVFHYDHVGYEYTYQVSPTNSSYTIMPLGSAGDSWFETATTNLNSYNWSKQTLQDQVTYTGSGSFAATNGRTYFYSFGLNQSWNAVWQPQPAGSETPSENGAEQNPNTLIYTITANGNFTGQYTISDQSANVPSPQLPPVENLPDDFFRDVATGTSYLESFYRSYSQNTVYTVRYTPPTPETLQKFQITNDSNYQGKYAYRYYATGRSSSSQTDSNGANVREVSAWLTDYQTQSNYRGSISGNITWVGDHLDSATYSSAHHEEGQLLRNRYYSVSIYHKDYPHYSWDSRYITDEDRAGNYTQDVNYNGSWDSTGQPLELTVTSSGNSQLNTQGSTVYVGIWSRWNTPQGFAPGRTTTSWLRTTDSHSQSKNQYHFSSAPLTQTYHLRQKTEVSGTDTELQYLLETHQVWDNSANYSYSSRTYNSAAWEDHTQQDGQLDASGKLIGGTYKQDRSRNPSWDNKYWWEITRTNQPKEYTFTTDVGNGTQWSKESRDYQGPDQYTGSKIEHSWSSQKVTNYTWLIGSYTQDSITYTVNNRYRSTEDTESTTRGEFTLSNGDRSGTFNSYTEVNANNAYRKLQTSSDPVNNASGSYFERGSGNNQYQDTIHGVIYSGNSGQYSRTVFSSDDSSSGYLLQARGQYTDSQGGTVSWSYRESTAPETQTSIDQPKYTKAKVTTTFTSTDGWSWTEVSRSFETDTNEQVYAKGAVREHSEYWAPDGSTHSSSTSITEVRYFEKDSRKTTGNPDNFTFEHNYQRNKSRTEILDTIHETFEPLYPTSNHHRSYFFTKENLTDNRKGTTQQGNTYFSSIFMEEIQETWHNYDWNYSDPERIQESHYRGFNSHRINRQGDSNSSTGEETIESSVRWWGKDIYLPNSVSSYGDPNRLTTTKEVYSLRWEGENLVERVRTYPTWRDQVAQGFYYFLTGNYGQAFQTFAGLAEQAIDYFAEVTAYYGQRALEFGAGLLSGLTAGLSDRVIGYFSPETLEQLQQSSWYQAGAITGTVVAIAAAFVNPCSLAASGSALLRFAGSAYRVWQGVEAIGNAINAIDAYKQGDYFGAALHGAGAIFGVAQALRACFTAGTKLLTPHGPKAIETFQVGDEILTRLEWEPDAPVLVSQVEARFENVARIWHLHLASGQVIRTTAEHPFYVDGRGWVPAGELRPGDLLVSHDGQRVAVAELYDTGTYERVYNLAIRSFHTYFVCDETWPFSIWAHNRYKVSQSVEDYARRGKTKNFSAWFETEGEARALAMRKLGPDPVKVGPGKLRSRDGRWQYRAKPGDLAEKHVHLELLDPRTGEVLVNWHLRFRLFRGEY
jgi:hypothetical protein